MQLPLHLRIARDGSLPEIGQTISHYRILEKLVEPAAKEESATVATENAAD